MKKIITFILFTALFTALSSCKKDDETTNTDDFVETRITVNVSLENNSEKEDVRVKLYRSDESLASTQYTNANGSTTFRGYEAGEYYIVGSIIITGGPYYQSEDLEFALGEEEQKVFDILLLEE